MTSGRKERVMICCVTFETTKITDPAKYYEATKIHIIHSSHDGSKDSVYQEFYDTVCSILRENREDIVIVDHNEKTVSNFTHMLRTVLNIIESERCGETDCDIYVNISAGTSEYAAASAIASMMDSDTILFSVGTKNYTVPKERIKECYYKDDRPVGLTETTKEPKMLERYAIEKPGKSLVCGLRILSERINRKEPTMGPDIIAELKENGLWEREPPSKPKKNRTTSLQQSEAVYYYRDFVKKWQDEGWVIKNEFKKRYELTPLGKIIINTFYVSHLPTAEGEQIIDK